MATHEKAIVISRWTATVGGTLLTALIIGGFGFAWQVNAQMENVEDLNDANLPERMVKIEEQGKNMSSDIDEIKDYVKDLNKKVDIIIQNGTADRNERRERDR